MVKPPFYILDIYIYTQEYNTIYILLQPHEELKNNKDDIQKIFFILVWGTKLNLKKIRQYSVIICRRAQESFLMLLNKLCFAVNRNQTFHFQNSALALGVIFTV